MVARVAGAPAVDQATAARYTAYVAGALTRTASPWTINRLEDFMDVRRRVAHGTLVNVPADKTLTKVELLSTPVVWDLGFPANPAVLATWTP